MRYALAILLLTAITASAEWRIRVTDDQGNVATTVISATNRVATINEWVALTMPGAGSGADKVAAMLEGILRGNAATWKREAIRAQKRQEADAAAEQVAE